MGTAATSPEGGFGAEAAAAPDREACGLDAPSTEADARDLSDGKGGPSGAESRCCEATCPGSMFSEGNRPSSGTMGAGATLTGGQSWAATRSGFASAARGTV